MEHIALANGLYDPSDHTTHRNTQYSEEDRFKEMLKLDRNLGLEIGIEFDDLLQTISSYARNFLNNFKEGFFFDENIDPEKEHFSYYKSLTRMSNSTEYFLILGNLYLLGEASSGVKPSRWLCSNFI